MAIDRRHLIDEPAIAPPNLPLGRTLNPPATTSDETTSPAAPRSRRRRRRRRRRRLGPFLVAERVFPETPPYLQINKIDLIRPTATEI